MLDVLQNFDDLERYADISITACVTDLSFADL